MIGQLDAPPISRETVTWENVVKWLVIPWLVMTALDRFGIIKRVPFREAFAPFPSERHRRRRRR